MALDLQIKEMKDKYKQVDTGAAVPKIKSNFDTPCRKASTKTYFSGWGPEPGIPCSSWESQPDGDFLKFTADPRVHGELNSEVDPGSISS